MTNILIVNDRLMYVGNVAVISMKANAIKSNATPAEVARVLVWMKSVEKIK